MGSRAGVRGGSKRQKGGGCCALAPPLPHRPSRPHLHKHGTVGQRVRQVGALEVRIGQHALDEVGAIQLAVLEAAVPAVGGCEVGALQKMGVGGVGWVGGSKGRGLTTRYG